MLSHTDNISTINISYSNRLFTETSLKGNQLKWFKNNKFIKLNTPNWNEDISEVLVSHLLQFTNINYYVKYYACNIIEDGKELGVGCYSESFLNNSELDITFYRLFKQYGYNITKMHYDEVRDKLQEITSLDFKPYIDSCLCIDAIVYNEDRHFNNFSVIKTKDAFRFAPLYDFGLSCLADTIAYPFSDDLDSCIKRVMANPFKSDFKYQLKEARVTPILIRYNDFINSVEVKTIEEKRAFDTICYGLNEMKGLAWEEY